MLLPKKYRLGISISLIFITALFILLFNLYHPSPGFLRKMALEMVSPMETAINLPLQGLADVWNRYIFLVGREESNKRLREQNSQLVEELIKYREGYQEGIRLQKILKLRDSLPFPILAARVVGRNPSSIFKMILINRGGSDGLRAGLPVMAVSGLVGRILETSWHVSRVLLIIDENSNISALLQESRAQGVLQGASSSGCNLKYVSKATDVKVGEVVISSGLDGVFPKGLPLGVVRSVSKKEADLFQRINVAPFVNPVGIEEVLVIIPAKDENK
ncbi:MAG: rod shape-determining protein MreC [Deltaproteobacteria bacterium]|nr:rod shape-determining protein MreC [Deltaproteobacteria bacterium]